MGGENPRESRQLRGFEKVRGEGIHRRRLRSGTGAHPRTVFAAGEVLQGAWPRNADRHESRFAERPHHEPLRRHAARHGRERAGVCPHRARSRISRVRLLDEVEQPEGDDSGLPHARRAARCGGGGLELPDSPRRDRGRRWRGWAHQVRHRNRLAAERRNRRHDPRFTHRGQRA